MFEGKREKDQRTRNKKTETGGSKIGGWRKIWNWHLQASFLSSPTPSSRKMTDIKLGSVPLPLTKKINAKGRAVAGMQDLGADQ